MYHETAALSIDPALHIGPPPLPKTWNEPGRPPFAPEHGVTGSVADCRPRFSPMPPGASQSVISLADSG